MSLMSITAEEFEDFSSRGYTIHNDLYAVSAYETKYVDAVGESAERLALLYYFQEAHKRSQ